MIVLVSETSDSEKIQYCPYYFRPNFSPTSRVSWSVLCFSSQLVLLESIIFTFDFNQQFFGTILHLYLNKKVVMVNCQTSRLAWNGCVYRQQGRVGFQPNKNPKGTKQAVWGEVVTNQYT